jgi:hypothetical protein
MWCHLKSGGGNGNGKCVLHGGDCSYLPRCVCMQTYGKLYSQGGHLLSIHSQVCKPRLLAGLPPVYVPLGEDETPLSPFPAGPSAFGNPTILKLFEAAGVVSQHLWSPIWHTAQHGATQWYNSWLLVGQLVCKTGYFTFLMMCCTESFRTTAH